LPHILPRGSVHCRVASFDIAGCTYLSAAAFKNSIKMGWGKRALLIYSG